MNSEEFIAKVLPSVYQKFKELIQKEVTFQFNTPFTSFELQDWAMIVANDSEIVTKGGADRNFNAEEYM
jgi:hypothetical protein